MKTFAFFALLFAFSAQASGYDCQFTVEQDGFTRGIIAFEQDVGTGSGRLYSVSIARKKNAFGKTVESTDVVLEGVVQNGGESSGETGIDATFTLVKSSERKTLVSRSTSTTRIVLATIKGKGNVRIEQRAAEDYVIRGGCSVNE